MISDDISTTFRNITMSKTSSFKTSYNFCYLTVVISHTARRNVDYSRSLHTAWEIDTSMLFGVDNQSCQRRVPIGLYSLLSNMYYTLYKHLWSNYIDDEALKQTKLRITHNTIYIQNGKLWTKKNHSILAWWSWIRAPLWVNYTFTEYKKMICNMFVIFIHFVSVSRKVIFFRSWTWALHTLMYFSNMLNNTINNFELKK